MRINSIFSGNDFVADAYSKPDKMKKFHVPGNMRCNILKKLFAYLLIFVSMIAAGISHAQIGQYAVSLNGTDDYISMPSGVYFSSNTFTIEAWVYIRSFNDYCRLIDFGDATNTGNNHVIAGISEGTSGKPFFNIYSSGSGSYFAATSTLVLNKWNHIAFVLNGSTGYIYINGKQAGSGSLNTPLNVTRTQNYVGRSNWTANGYSDMKIDELRIWSTARTTDQLKTNMYKELAGTETGLLAYYRMSNGSGTSVTDNTGHGYNGTLLHDNVWKASGCFAGPGNALDFDGTDDYVQIPNTSSIQVSTVFTVEAWINNRILDGRKILGKSDANAAPPGFNIGLNTDSTIWYEIMGSWSSYIRGSGSLKCVPLTWNHIAMSWSSGGYLKGYLNGIEVLSLSSGSFSISTSNKMIIGKAPWDNLNQGHFNGKIDEVRLWNIVRTQDQIKENMMKTLVGNESGLVAYYRMDNCDGTTVYDITSNGNNGTMTNMDAATDWVSSSAFNTWIGCDCSTWSNSANWSLSSAPASSDNVGIYNWGSGNSCTVSGIPTVKDLLISSTSSPVLSSNIAVTGAMILEKNLDLGDKIVIFGSTGYLDEGSYRVYGSTGTMTSSVNLSNISSKNIGGLGAVLTSSANLGSTTITRGHSQQTFGSAKSILRYYDISPANNSGLNATLVFRYNENELNGIPEANLRLFRSTDNGTTWTLMGGVVDAANNTVTLTGISGFSRWTLGDLNSPLPAELCSFTSILKKRDALIKWTTLSEENNSGFEVQRAEVQSGSSGNANPEFVKIGFVQGVGTSHAQNNYSYEDRGLVSGKYLYRLKQIDFNGNFNYYEMSGAVIVGLPDNFELSQNYPNPFNPSTRIDFSLPEDSRVTLKIYDISGREIKSLYNGVMLNANYYSVVFSGDELSSGIFFYRLTAGKYVISKKMILIK